MWNNKILELISQISKVVLNWAKSLARTNKIIRGGMNEDELRVWMSLNGYGDAAHKAPLEDLKRWYDLGV